MEEEIDLKKYVKFLLENKFLIIIFAVVGVLIGSAVFFKTPQKYEASALFEIGKVQGSLLQNPLGLTSLFESPDELSQKIKLGAYGVYDGLDAVGYNNTSLVKIIISSNNPDKAKENVNTITHAILVDHEAKLDSYQSSIKQTIESVKKDKDYFLNRNQDAASLQVKIYDLQEKLENYKPSKILNESASLIQKKKTIGYYISFGFFAGAFLGLVAAIIKKLWVKQKNISSV